MSQFSWFSLLIPLMILKHERVKERVCHGSWAAALPAYLLFSSIFWGDEGVFAPRPSKPLEMSSKVLPLVSGTLKNVKIKNMTRKTRKMRKT